MVNEIKSNRESGNSSSMIRKMAEFWKSEQQTAAEQKKEDQKEIAKESKHFRDLSKPTLEEIEGMKNNLQRYHLRNFISNPYENPVVGIFLDIRALLEAQKAGGKRNALLALGCICAGYQYAERFVHDPAEKELIPKDMAAIALLFNPALNSSTKWRITNGSLDQYKKNVRESLDAIDGMDIYYDRRDNSSPNRKAEVKATLELYYGSVGKFANFREATSGAVTRYALFGLVWDYMRLNEFFNKLEIMGGGMVDGISMLSRENLEPVLGKADLRKMGTAELKQIRHVCMFHFLRQAYPRKIFHKLYSTLFNHIYGERFVAEAVYALKLEQQQKQQRS